MTAAPTCEWARVAPDEIIVADARSARLHRPDPIAPDPFRAPMTGPGSVETTRWLLEGAIAAGLRAARDDAAGLTPPPLDLHRWAWRLCGLYHMTTETPALLAEAEARFTALARPALATWAADRRREETGHDRLALRDLAALGLDPAIVHRVHPPAARRLVDWFRAAVRDEPLPLGAIAYAHTVERLALRFGRAYLDRVLAILPRGVDATRCLRVHSAVGTDAGHVDDNISVVAALPADERARIALACREVAWLSSTPPTGGYCDRASLLTMFGSLGASEPGADPKKEWRDG